MIVGSYIPEYCLWKRLDNYYQLNDIEKGELVVDLMIYLEEKMDDKLVENHIKKTIKELS